MNHVEIVLSIAGALALVSLALGGMIFALTHRE